MRRSVSDGWVELVGRAGPGLLKETAIQGTRVELVRPGKVAVSRKPAGPSPGGGRWLRGTASVTLRLPLVAQRSRIRL